MPIDGTRLAFAREQAGLTRLELAKRVSAHLQRRARFRSGASQLPQSISEVSLHHWERGKPPRTCGESVLSALAVVLKVRPPFLKGETDFVPVRFPMPGLRVPVELEMNRQGEMIRKQWVPSDDIGYSALLQCFTSLDFWRMVLVEGELPEQKEGAHLTFLKYMVKALQILLEPLNHGARLKRVGVVDLVCFVGTGQGSDSLWEPDEGDDEAEAVSKQPTLKRIEEDLP